MSTALDRVKHFQCFKLLHKLSSNQRTVAACPNSPPRKLHVLEVCQVIKGLLQPRVGALSSYQRTVQPLQTLAFRWRHVLEVNQVNKGRWQPRRGHVLQINQGTKERWQPLWTLAPHIQAAPCVGVLSSYQRTLAASPKSGTKGIRHPLQTPCVGVLS